MSDKINALLMFEMLGMPPSYLKEMLSEHVEKLGKEKGLKIISKKIAEAKEVKDSQLFAGFVEVEAELDGIPELMNIIFGYMPCHVEVIKPENFRMSNYDLNVLSNELVRRLHEYDGIVKIAQLQNQELAKKLQEMMQKMGSLPQIAEAQKAEKKKVKSKKTKKK